MELFSWHKKGDDTWHFALLPGPGADKLKSAEFVTSKENTIDSPAALKRKIAALAMNEKIGWFTFGISALGLILTFVPHIGVKVGGAHRWIQLPLGVRFEPAELFSTRTKSSAKTAKRWNWASPSLRSSTPADS